VAELDVEVELELAVLIEEDDSEDDADDALVVEEAVEVEGEACVVELAEVVEVVVVRCGEVTTYAAPSKTRAATKAAAATCALLAPVLFKSGRPARATGPQPSRTSP
jgi:hypothetical protein